MRPTPKSWPRASSAVFYDDAAKAIDWLCNAFGFEVRLKVEGPNGSIAHSELTYGEAVFMIGTAAPDRGTKSALATGGFVTQSSALYIDDVDAHCARARAAGAKIAVELRTNDYGPGYWVDRSYEAVDFEGQRWWFSQRLETR